jgi:hypothetical protein
MYKDLYTNPMGDHEKLKKWMSSGGVKELADTLRIKFETKWNTQQINWTTQQIIGFFKEVKKKVKNNLFNMSDFYGPVKTSVSSNDFAVLTTQEAIQKTSKEQIIDKVTYTWFNRFMALRFMDANDYQPIGVRVLTPKEGFTLPELLDEAKKGHIPEELSVKNQRIYDLLDGKIPSNNAQNEAYKDLLIGACNHLNKVLPFLFERINDYTELLLPDDLTSELSIIQDIRDGMSIEDCAEVEVIGWLYQFYISYPLPNYIILCCNYPVNIDEPN